MIQSIQEVSKRTLRLLIELFRRHVADRYAIDHALGASLRRL
jgi:hypothetical protein